MKKIFLHIFLFTTSLLFVSCNEEVIDSVDNVEATAYDDPYFVDSRYAQAAASMVTFPVDSGGTRSILSKEYREIKQIIPFGKSDKPSFYIVNYKNDGGFLILAADKRVNPLLAFSYTGNFIVDYTEMPSSLVDWMQESHEGIEDLRKNGIPDSLQSRLRWGGDYDPSWNLCEMQDILGPNPELCGEYDPCEQIAEWKTSLLKTEWHQGSPYNSALDDCGCTGSDLYGRPPAGCVAIATAQVMRYYEYPKGYDYFYTSEQARLVKDVGEALNTSYKCSGSGSYPDRIPNVLKNIFGYSSANHKNGFDSSLVVSQLRNNRPVILAGSKSTTWSFIGIHGDGHVWVCDGYRTLENCHARALYFHMNWGWGAGWNNLYLGVGEWWKSPNGAYSKNQQMVYNIVP